MSTAKPVFYGCHKCSVTVGVTWITKEYSKGKRNTHHRPEMLDALSLGPVRNRHAELQQFTTNRSGRVYYQHPNDFALAVTGSDMLQSVRTRPGVSNAMLYLVSCILFHSHRESRLRTRVTSHHPHHQTSAHRHTWHTFSHSFAEDHLQFTMLTHWITRPINAQQRCLCPLPYTL